MIHSHCNQQVDPASSIKLSSHLATAIKQMDDSIKAIVTRVTDWNINNKDKYDISNTGHVSKMFPCLLH